ncbi:hypothetical protein CYMTET_29679 [Cymbomonas tetramitiformis]|uniref:Uncharacterized protein n=1 Tax=Cymbomonas tetramitiformis TaxID=36881 RepID=A0AAE0FLZ0_9CHLO|nr:hypothetical protein CYMTET_29679 [Cymbomonas tetramitiformis]
MNTPSPPSSEAETILSVEVDNPGTPEKEPKLEERYDAHSERISPATGKGGWPGGGYTRTPGLIWEELRDQVVDPLTVAQKEMKTVTILLSLLGDLLLDLLSSHRVDLVDLVEVEPYR